MKVLGDEYPALDQYAFETEVRDMERFEALALSQKPADKPWEPVTDYSFEARKAIEGIHPQLIKDVFSPRDVLNVGCGTGFLDGQLRDGSVSVEGMDLNPPSGEHFWRQDICDDRPIIEWELPYTGFDLVICREVLEHLTLLFQRRAVTNLCKLSRRYVYVTTRFSSEHNLLHVETKDDLDPTHITLPSKDLLRLLFVLEGFKRRADLEERMDHQKKHRVLVYERAS